jgi:hypothetical protein
MAKLLLKKVMVDVEAEPQQQIEDVQVVRLPPPGSGSHLD